MKNKELIQNKLERLNNQIRSLKLALNRGYIEQINDSLSKIESSIEDIENIISLEDGSFSTSQFGGL